MPATTSTQNRKHPAEHPHSMGCIRAKGRIYLSVLVASELALRRALVPRPERTGPPLDLNRHPADEDDDEHDRYHAHDCGDEKPTLEGS